MLAAGGVGEASAVSAAAVGVVFEAAAVLLGVGEDTRVAPTTVGLPLAVPEVGGELLMVGVAVEGGGVAVCVSVGAGVGVRVGGGGGTRVGMMTGGSGGTGRSVGSGASVGSGRPGGAGVAVGSVGGGSSSSSISISSATVAGGRGGAGGRSVDAMRAVAPRRYSEVDMMKSKMARWSAMARRSLRFPYQFSPW